MTKEVVCPNCHAPIPADDINLATGLAKCQVCNRAFLISPSAPTGPTNKPNKPVIQKPDNFELRREGDVLVIERAWRDLGSLIILAVATLWNIAVFATLSQSGTLTLKSIFTSPYMYIGLLLAYIAACKIVNRTIYRVGKGQLRIEVVPLPFFGGRVLAAGEINQLYCAKVITNQRRDKGMSGISTSSEVSYELRLITSKGDRLTIGRSFPSREHVLFLEQQIEAALNIEDVWVDDEVGNLEPADLELKDAFDFLKKK